MMIAPIQIQGERRRRLNRRNENTIIIKKEERKKEGEGGKNGSKDKGYGCFPMIMLAYAY